MTANASQISDLLGLAKQTVRRLRPRHLLWASLVYLSLILLAYGAAWLKFGQTTLGVLSSGGAVLSGRVISLKSSGFGKYRNYFIKLDSMAQPIMIPGLLINSRTPSESTPVIDLGLEVGEGTLVQIATSGGGNKAVVLGLKASDGGSTREILVYSNSVSRFTDAVAQAPYWGWFYIAFGALLTPILGFAFPWILRLPPVQAQFQKAKKALQK